MFQPPPQLDSLLLSPAAALDDGYGGGGGCDDGGGGSLYVGARAAGAPQGTCPSPVGIMLDSQLW